MINVNDTIQVRETTMSLSDKMATISTILIGHYSSVTTLDPSGKIESIINQLKQIGATSEASLQELTADDFQSFGVPALIARRIVKSIGCAISTDVQKQVVIIDDNPVNLAARLKPEELVEQYDPNDPTSPFGARLLTISNNSKFFAYTEDGKVNIPKSQQFLRELLDGYSVRTTAMVDGKLVELFAVGERPARYADENPAVPNTFLRPDGVSDMHVNWGILNLEVKQLVWVAVKIGETKKNEIDLYDEVKSLDFNHVALRFPQSAVKFESMKGTQQLPSLKLVLKAKVVAPK